MMSYATHLDFRLFGVEMFHYGLEGIRFTMYMDTPQMLLIVGKWKFQTSNAPQIK
jgi:hypothetical protein